MIGVTPERLLNSFIILMWLFYALMLHHFHTPVCTLPLCGLAYDFKR